MLNVGNASSHNYEVVMTGNTSEPCDRLSLNSNSTNIKVDGWGYDLNDDITGISLANVTYSSPVVSNAPHTCTELSLHLISQDDCFLVSYRSSQVMHLYSFSIDQQYLVDTGHCVCYMILNLCNTKVVLGNFVILKIEITQKVVYTIFYSLLNTT